MGLRNYLMACPGKNCIQQRHLKRQELSRTNLLTVIIYALMTQYLQESTVKAKCCYMSTGTGRQGAKPVPSSVMFIPLLLPRIPLPLFIASAVCWLCFLGLRKVGARDINAAQKYLLAQSSSSQAL